MNVCACTCMCKWSIWISICYNKVHLSMKCGIDDKAADRFWCVGSQFPRASSTRTQQGSIAHTVRQRKKLSLEIWRNTLENRPRKYPRLPSRQDPLLKLADRGAQWTSSFKQKPSVFALVLRQAHTLSKRGHTLLCEVPSTYMPTRYFSSSCAPASSSCLVLSALACRTLRVRSEGAERGWQQRWKMAMKVSC